MRVFPESFQFDTKWKLTRAAWWLKMRIYIFTFLSFCLKVLHDLVNAIRWNSNKFITFHQPWVMDRNLSRNLLEFKLHSQFQHLSYFINNKKIIKKYFFSIYRGHHSFNYFYVLRVILFLLFFPFLCISNEERWRLKWLNVKSFFYEMIKVQFFDWIQYEYKF